MSDAFLVYEDHKPDARNVKVRIAKPEDAQNLQSLINNLMRDGKYYLGDSLPYSVEEEAAHIKRSGKNHIILLAEDENCLIGWVSLNRDWATFSRHIGNVLIGVKSDHQGFGVGTQLLVQIEPMALYMNIEKLELAVRASNLYAFEFCKRNGYIVEGKKNASVKFNGKYDDEILMGKQLR